jgi:hypothetical protein
LRDTGRAGQLNPTPSAPASLARAYASSLSMCRGGPGFEKSILILVDSPVTRYERFFGWNSGRRVLHAPADFRLKWCRSGLIGKTNKEETGSRKVCISRLSQKSFVTVAPTWVTEESQCPETRYIMAELRFFVSTLSRHALTPIIGPTILKMQTFALRSKEIFIYYIHRYGTIYLCEGGKSMPDFADDASSIWRSSIGLRWGSYELS